MNKYCKTKLRERALLGKWFVKAVYHTITFYEKLTWLNLKFLIPLKWSRYDKINYNHSPRLLLE